MVAAFEKATGIKVLMTRKSSGEFYAQLKAEAGESARRHLVGRHRRSASAGGRGRSHRARTSRRSSPTCRTGRCARRKRRNSGRSASTPARWAIATTRISSKKKNIPAPKCWADLTKAQFKDEIQVANPNSSGTSYTMLATLVQLMGEDKAFEYLKALHKNVNQYTKSGAAPARAAATGEELRRDHVPARRSGAGDRGAPVVHRVAVRRHRVRDRQHEHHQGREEHGERQEVVRLGAHARGAGDRRAGQGELPGAIEQERADARGRRRS